MSKEKVKKQNDNIDLTAYEAIAKATKREEERHIQIQEAIKIVKKLLAIFGLKLENRMVLKDLDTGKKYY